MASITGANAVVMISIFPIFPVPLQLQGFAADDVFSSDAIESAETLMGVDGILSAGWVAVPVMMNYALQADSTSVFIFDQWWAAQQQAQDIFRANSSVWLPSLNKKWAQTRGVLSNYKPTPDIKKLAQPQRFRITWERSIPTVF